MNVVDVTGREGRALPLTRPAAKPPAPKSLTPPADAKLPWDLGFAESIGRDAR